MSKSLPINTIKQASNDKILKLLIENTLSEIADKPPLLTNKEKEALANEARERQLLRTYRLHYDLATAVRFLRVDMDNTNWCNRYLTNMIKDIFDEWLQIGSLFTNEWLKPKNDDQRTYRDLIIKDLTIEGKKKTPDEWLKEWEITVIKIKQYMLEIREVGKLLDYQIVSDDTKEYVKSSRFLFYIATVQLSETLDELLYDYKVSKEFREWLNKQGIKRDNLKKALKIVKKHEPKEPLLSDEEKTMTVEKFKEARGIENVEKYISDYPIEEVGLSEKDLIPVTEFMDLIKRRYGITE